MISIKMCIISSRVHTTLQPVLSVCLSVGHLVRYTLLFFFAAPAHLQETKGTVYPAFFLLFTIDLWYIDL